MTRLLRNCIRILLLWFLAYACVIGSLLSSKPCACFVHSEVPLTLQIPVVFLDEEMRELTYGSFCSCALYLVPPLGVCCILSFLVVSSS